MIKAYNREDGFTMVELMITVAIIAILTAISVPIYNNQRKKADLASVKEDIHNTAILVEQEKARNGSYTTALPGQAGGSALKSKGSVLTIKLLPNRVPATACIQGSHTKHTATADKSYYILSEKKLKTGLCPAT